MTARAAFAPRDGAGALVFDDAMWLIGGWNPRDPIHFPRVCSNDVWRSTDGRDWSPVKSNAYLDDTFDTKQDWARRRTGGYAVHEHRMWLIGGDANQGYHQSDVWASADGRDWQCVLEEALWAPRGMVGGSVVYFGRLWILGGGTYETPDTPGRTFRNDVWSTSDGIHWSCHTAGAPWTPRQYHQTAVFDDRMWVLAGWNRVNLKDVWYSTDGTDWFEVPDTPWPARHAASVFVYCDALWVVAGSHMASDVWKLERD